MRKKEKYLCMPHVFSTALRLNAKVSRNDYLLIFYIMTQTYKRWIRDKNLESNGLDWIDLNYEKINRECFNQKGSMATRRSLNRLSSQNIIVYDRNISKIRINYKPDTWSI